MIVRKISDHALVRMVTPRILWAIATLVFTSVFVFTATQLMPGNVAQLMLGQFGTPEAIKALEVQMGLDRPATMQFLEWAGRVLQGDFGESLRMRLPVGPLIYERLFMSLSLAAFALVLVSVLGVMLGTLAALRNRKASDRVISGLSLLGISMPEFVSGSLLILAFSGVLPTSGYASPKDGIGQWLMHMILPVITLTFIMLAHVVRTSRVSMIDALSAPYVRTAVLKGLPKRTVVFKHALRNALLPTLTVLGINVGYLIGGVVVVELVFSYPGLGRLTIFSVQTRDIPLMQACILTMATIYIVASFLTDMAYLALNPRLRVAK